jgi:L-2-hydroxycarboxylate dehydrogenase (NAD+)
LLERFKVPEEDQVRIDHKDLRSTVEAVFLKLGCSQEHAAAGADTLVSTDLRGVETHGVSNMLRAYVREFQSGKLNCKPEVKVIRETPGTVSLDGDRGLGVILAPGAMKRAIDKAKNVGIGICVMQNSGHMGAIGHHAMLAAKEGMVGMTTTSGGSGTRVFVLPTFAAEPRFGTNPIAIAAPARSQPYLLFDAATSAIAGNKIGLAERVGSMLEPGWIAKLDGTPIVDPIHSPGSGNYWQLPLGGVREQGSHKGFGLSMIPEILGTMLSGARPGMLPGERLAQDHYFAAYNIEAFTDPDWFLDTMDEMLTTLRNTKPAPGHDRVLYPGLPEYEEELNRIDNGIPLHKEVIEWFDGITAELGLSKLARK